MKTYTIEELRQKSSNVSTPTSQIKSFLDWLEAQQVATAEEDIEKEDLRPAKCLLCNEKMYYYRHPKWEEEYAILLEKNNKPQALFYVHCRCWDAKYFNKSKEEVQKNYENEDVSKNNIGN